MVQSEPENPYNSADIAIFDMVAVSGQLHLTCVTCSVGGLLTFLTKRGARMNRASVSHFGRSGNSNLAGLNPGQVKRITLKLIRVAF